MRYEQDAPSLAVFCDFENVAIGVKEAHYDAFDINLVIERLLDKGKIVVKKAYCDWERYRSSKRALHEAGFELIEIPHVSYSGKNSADIRMCVDALDLCYTKGHVDMFAIVSGDSDFSPLVSKLRENAKMVVGIGVKNSSGDILIENCDDFIFYDDLVRQKTKSGKQGRADKRAGVKKAAEKPKKPGEKPRVEGDKAKVEGDKAKAEPDKARPNGDKAAEPRPADSAAPEAATAEAQSEKRGDPAEAIELLLDTVEALFRDREDNLWGSHVKQTIKRKKPHFDESYFGYRTFNQLLEDAARHELLEIQKDEKSGGYLITAFGPNA